MTEISSTCLHGNDNDCNNNGSKYQHTPLSLACWNGDLDLATFLIDEGVDPNARTPQGILPLHFSCMRSKSFRILPFLLGHHRIEVDIDAATDGDGITPLMYASSFGLLKTVEFLLGRKADVNKQDGSGQSALFYAVKGGHIPIMQQLISHNACVYFRDDENANLLHHLIASYSRIPLVSFEIILTYLVDEVGLDINTKMRNGATPLHKACHFGLVGVTQYLIRKGGDLEAKKDCWETPLWSHVKSPSPTREMIMLLFNNGANFQVKNLLGMSLVDYSTRFLENEELSAVLGEVQNTLKRRRMEEMRAKRKAIWSNDLRSSPVISFTSPPQSPPIVIGCDWSPDPILVREGNVEPKASSNEKLIEVREVSDSSNSSGSSDSSTSDDDDDDTDKSESETSSLSSVSSDDDDDVMPAPDVQKASENENNQERITNTVQIPAVSTTTSESEAERVTTRQLRKRTGKNKPSPSPMEIIPGLDIINEDIINISSDESGDGNNENIITQLLKTEAVSPPPPDSESGVLRRSQRNSRRTAKTDVQAERIKRKRQTVVITISDSE